MTDNDWLNGASMGKINYPLKIVYQKVVDEKSTFTFEDAMAFVEGDTVLV